MREMLSVILGIIYANASYFIIIIWYTFGNLVFPHSKDEINLYIEAANQNTWKHLGCKSTKKVDLQVRFNLTYLELFLSRT